MSAALKSAVTPAQPRRQVAYIISELVKRLKEATDWLVRSRMLAHAGGMHVWVPCDCRGASHVLLGMDCVLHGACSIS